MAEPTSSASVSLAVIAVTLAGPLAGPYALIMFSALAGSLWPLSVASTATRLAGAGLLLRCTLTSVILTGGASSWLHSSYGWQINELIAPVAFFLAALGNDWKTVIRSITGLLSTILQRNPQAGSAP